MEQNAIKLPDYVTPEYLAALKLRNGCGSGKPGERCAIQEVRAWLDLDPSRDEIPDCVSRPLGRFVIKLNDAHPIARELLAPHLHLLLGTAGIDARRIAFKMADFAVRECAPVALAARGRQDLADGLKALAEIVDYETAKKAQKAAYAAADAADADAAAAAAAAYAADAAAAAAAAAAAYAADAAAAAAAAYAAADAAYAAAAYAAAYAADADAAADARRALYARAVAVLVEICGWAKQEAA